MDYLVVYFEYLCNDKIVNEKISNIVLKKEA